jgi:hypothetical protein
MKHLIAISTAFIMGLLVASSAGAEDAKPPEWLFVHTAVTAEMTSMTTLVMPVERDIFAFTDRPNRLHTYLTAEQFAGLWARDPYKGDSLKLYNPTAVFTWLEPKGGVGEAEVVITSAFAAADGKTIVYGLEFVDKFLGAGLSIVRMVANPLLFVDAVLSDGGVIHERSSYGLEVRNGNWQENVSR